MSNNTGGPVFPTEIQDHEGLRHRSEGMTLRDYFAAKALQSMIAADYQLGRISPAVFAANAFAMADAMLKVRQQ